MANIPLYDCPENQMVLYHQRGGHGQRVRAIFPARPEMMMTLIFRGGSEWAKIHGHSLKWIWNVLLLYFNPLPLPNNGPLRISRIVKDYRGASIQVDLIRGLINWTSAQLAMQSGVRDVPRVIWVNTSDKDQQLTPWPTEWSIKMWWTSDVSVPMRVHQMSSNDPFPIA